MACCSDGGEIAMGTGARSARAVAGLGFLAAAGALAERPLRGGIALWPASLIPTWFGISHLVAAVIGYRGCPELGAIPSVMLGRRVETSCEPWRRIDGFIERSGAFSGGNHALFPRGSREAGRSGRGIRDRHRSAGDPPGPSSERRVP